MDGTESAEPAKLSAELVDDAPQAERGGVPTGLVLFMLGGGVGCNITGYFSSIGYFQVKLGSLMLFSYMALVVMFVQFITTYLQGVYDRSFDVQYGWHTAIGFRIVFPGLMHSLLTMSIPFCSSVAQVVVLGAVNSFFLTSQASSSSQLGACIMAGGNIWVQFGIRIGGIVPLVGVLATGFKADSSRFQALVYFGSLACYASLGVLIFALYHIRAGRVATDPSFRSEEKTSLARSGTSNLTSVLPATYRTMNSRLSTTDAAAASSSAQSSAPSAEISLSSSAYVMQLMIFFTFFASLFPTPLFPLAGPNAAQALVLNKSVADSLGSAIGLFHSSRCRVAGAVSTLTQVACVILVIARCVACVFITLWLRGLNEKAVVSVQAHAALVLFFALGFYISSVLEMVPQLEVEETRRGDVARVSLMYQFAGNALGALTAIPILMKLAST
eukprot:TRINITY_DN29888_c0_g1_i1.p1 TRINITY_DN29888_c0_g1~~TRINITY_DN29888_c0_g1_i1.p1  ORF type:complete len:444 (-),score=42.31 TRINITY_DN29888_c0_g1_i1:261-1592(-)